jgi:hypothetical protein
MKYCLFLVQWMVLVTAVAAPAKAPTQTAPIGNRFLFIVETSTAMGRLEHGGRQAVFDLIYSGVDGRMRKGDTYGIWTFNESVYAGFYPMQTWEPRANLEHASAAGRFLKAQKYEKQASITNMVTQLQTVIRTVKDVNVFLVTEGGVAMVGTPFDGAINESYQNNRAQARETKQPLVTTLTARNGQITGAYVSFPGEKIVLADLPDTNSVARVEAPKIQPLATNQAPPKPVGQTVSVVDVETQTGVTNPAAITPDSKVNAVVTNGARVKHMVIIQKEAPATNAVPEPTINAGSADPIAPTNAVVVSKDASAPEVSTSVSAAPITNVAPTPVALKTNEVTMPPRPQALPAIVPPQVKVSARTVDEAARKTAAPSTLANALLIAGGMCVGMSLLAAVVFARRVRSVKQPSFISQGMDRR